MQIESYKEARKVVEEFKHRPDEDDISVDDYDRIEDAVAYIICRSVEKPDETTFVNWFFSLGELNR